MPKSKTPKSRVTRLREEVLKKVKAMDMNADSLRIHIKLHYLADDESICYSTVWKFLNNISAPNAELTLALSEWVKSN